MYKTFIKSGAMIGAIERYGREGDKQSILKELPVLGWRTVRENLNSFFMPHKSNRIQLTYIHEGVIDFLIDGELHTAKQGDVVVNMPNQVFSTLDGFFPKSKTAYSKIDMDSGSEFISSSSLNLYNNFFKNLSSPVISTGINFYYIFRKLLDEHRNPNSLSEVKCQIGFHELILSLIESSNEHFGPSNRYNNYSLQLINEFIAENVSRKIYVSEICELVNMDITQLKETFESQLGVSVCQYILNQRIDYAKKLMLNCKESITSIAFELGFSSSQYFSNQFKEVTGMRPRAFVKAYQKSLHKLHVLSDVQSTKSMDSFFVA